MTKQDAGSEFTNYNNLWLEVKRDIENKIISGYFAVGAKIPTITEMVECYGIGKSTAQKIINALYDDGVIVKQVGKGCFVKPFVKERLLERHRKFFLSNVEEVVAEAKILGLSRAEVAEIISEVFEKE